LGKLLSTANALNGKDKIDITIKIFLNNFIFSSNFLTTLHSIYKYKRKKIW